MSQPTSYEQLMLELVNTARAAAGAQPLAFNGDLNESADAHSAWMIGTDAFSHTGANGSTPTDRMQAAGYQFSGSWASAENIAWASVRPPSGYPDEVQLLHYNLMDSPGHRANLLNNTYREIGIGFATGEYQGWDGAFVTQNFARSGTGSLLTGVAFDDKDGDRAYDVGEGFGSVTVTAVSASGARFVTKTMTAGGYSLPLSSGAYQVTFSGSNIKSVTKSVKIGASNQKLDLVDPAITPGKVIVGTNGADNLKGTNGTDLIKGLGAADKLNGMASADRMFGGTGNDSLSGSQGNDRLDGDSGRDTLLGGSGNDVLTGGSHADVFQFRGGWGRDQITDFRNGLDHIDMRQNGLSFGALTITQIDFDGNGIDNDVRIDAKGQSIIIFNLKAALLTASDFYF